jgi:hypothetical protein
VSYNETSATEFPDRPALSLVFFVSRIIRDSSASTSGVKFAWYAARKPMQMMCKSKSKLLGILEN